MANAMWWLMDVVLPVILLIVLIWLVFRRHSSRADRTTYEGTKDLYAEEERRRREGTDDL
jgi:hypothetical protein